MTKSQRTIITVLSIIAVGLLLAIGISVYISYQTLAHQPLGPALPFAEQTLPPTWTPLASAQNSLDGSVTLVPTISFPTNPAAPLCGTEGVMNVLVIGADSRADSYIYGLADAIRVVRVDFSTPKVSVLEFPRDLWVEIPEIADNLNGQDHEKINQAYLYGQPGFKYWDDPSGGPGLLALTLNKNFGIKVDHYISVNMRTFVNIVNAVGGIDVYIQNKATAQYTGLQVGDHHLNGDQALKVARNRSGGSFERTDNQNIIMCALRKKLTSPTVVAQIPGLIDSFKDNVITDFTPAQLGQLACLGKKLPPQNIILASFPEGMFTQTRVYDPVFEKRIAILDADFNALREYVTRFQLGSWPEPPPPQQTFEPVDESAPITCK